MNLMHHTEAAEHQDEFLYKDQVTYATFHAVARYELKPLPWAGVECDRIQAPPHELE